MVFRFVKDYQPEILIIGGDFFDFYQISEFDKEPKRLLQLQDDLHLAVRFLKELRDSLPGTRIIFLEGNHEFRLTAFKWRRVPALAYLDALSPQKLFCLEELNIEYVDYRDFFQYNKLVFIHGTGGASESGVLAKTNLRRYGTNIIMGHGHKTAKITRTTLDGTIGAWEAGALCELKPEYVKGIANWSHGFCVIEYFKDVYFRVNDINIIRNTFSFEGKIYTSHADWTKEYNESQEERGWFSGTNANTSV